MKQVKKKRKSLDGGLQFLIFLYGDKAKKNITQSDFKFWQILSSDLISLIGAWWLISVNPNPHHWASTHVVEQTLVGQPTSHHPKIWPSSTAVDSITNKEREKKMEVISGL